MRFGLNKSDIDKINSVLIEFENVTKALIFGSRAKGNENKGSDIDLALFGDNLESNDVSKIRYILEEETNIPCFFDVIDYKKINKIELKEHIDRVGKLLYRKEN